jgi:serine/threonine-protein kinase
MFCSRCGTEVQNRAKFCPSCGLDLAATTPIAAVGQPLEESETDVVVHALQDEYEILEELGRGGMAIVYRARERQLDREVAIKVLPFSLGFDAEFVERFQREARTAARLEHPNIIHIYRVGKSGRVIYFVMKLLRGDSLSEILDRGGALPPQDIRRILAQTASALGYAHRHDIVHRDIKPDNIMFDESGHAVVTDFGIAKAASGTRLTGTGMSIGTPHYMSPEQARAQSLDGRSDIYSLGVVAYQCLTGSVPFDGEDSFAIGYKHIMEDLPEPLLAAAEHRSLYEVIRKMMAKSPDDRFQNAEELVTILELDMPLTGRRTAPSFSTAPTAAIPRPSPAPGGGVAAASPSTPITPIPGADRKPVLGRDREKRRERKKRSGVLVGMMVLLLLGGGGAGGYWYFFMDAQWPLPFLSGRPDPQLMPVDSLANPVDDSVFLAAGDSTAAAGPDSIQPGPDTAAVSDAGAGDSAGPPEVPITSLPNTGTLVVRVPRGARLLIDGEVVDRDSIEVDAGTYKVEVERTGFEKFETTVPVGRGQVVVLPVAMTEVEQPPSQPPPVTQPAVDICAQDVPSVEYFRTGQCYDSPPSTAGAPIISVQAAAQGVPAAVQLLVRVSTDGRPVRILPGRRVATTRYTLAAMTFARDSLQYSPAIKDGQLIEAWLRLSVRFRRR